MKALVIAENSSSAAKLAGGARAFGADDVSLVCFEGVVPDASDTSILLTVPDGALVDDAYLTLLPFAEESDVVIAEPTRRCKVIAGRIAARFSTSAISATVAFGKEARGMFFGGVAERVQKPRSGKGVYLVSPGLCDESAAFGAGAVVTADWVAPERAGRAVSAEPLGRTAADPADAEVVVAVGRGFAEEGQLQLAKDLAAKLGGAIACTRPLSEGEGWLPKELYVGVSGISVSPKLYIACGISGQMQHMVGCNKSGTVIAVNKDKNAPIFKQCDFGLVGDVNDVLPKLEAAL